jgi:hypothetical protein
MKIKNPEMMTPGWWSKNDALNIRKSVAEGVEDSCKYHFDVKIDKTGRLTIANHGNVTIHATGDRQPDWRGMMERDFGVVCDLASNFPGKLFCPKTHKVIPVSRIKNNQILWCDKEYGVAIPPLGVMYSAPDAAPIQTKLWAEQKSAIEWSFNNPKATAAFLERFKKICLEAKLHCALLELQPSSYLKDDVVYGWIKAVHQDANISDVQTANPSKEQLRELAFLGQQILKEQYGKFENHIKLMCADHYESPYLEYRP